MSKNSKILLPNKTFKQKKIILFFPSPFPYNRPWKGVPLALLAISRILDKENYEIKIYSRFLQKQIEKEILQNGENSICLGISAMTGFQIYDGLKMARLFKKKFPHIPIVWGGWHPSILPKETLKNKYVDIIIKGQGDETFPELIHALVNKKKLSDIKGLVYKRGKKFFETEDRPAADLTKLPPLPYHLIDIDKCIINTEYGNRTLPYISSYGCPHRCGFCVEPIINKHKWTAVPAKMVISEIEDLYKKYHIDSIAIYDSNFFVDEQRIANFCEGLLNKKIKIKWGNANGRVRQLSMFKPKTWQLMRDSGCSMILTGAESGSQQALNFIDKDINIKDIVKFTRLCKKYKIKILYSFLVGLPWSDNAQKNKKYINNEYKSTLSLIDKTLKISNRNRYTYYLFLPYPGSTLFYRAKKLGFKHPQSLKKWSTYLMSPEDAFKEVVKQQWITTSQARLTAMLTQYIFGLMDQDTYQVLLDRIPKGLKKLLFIFSFKIGLCLVRIRWRLKFFSLPLDYKIFTLIHKYGKLI